jgi:hypothetical protein
MTCLTPKGPLSPIRTIGSLGMSHNVNFHCDFVKLFLEVKECISFWEYNLFSIGPLKIKLGCPKNKIKLWVAPKNFKKNLKKLFNNFFMWNRSMSPRRA